MKEKGVIAWMAGHPVAANMLMIMIIIGGVMMSMNIKQEVFPELTLDRVNINIPYPGASPSEVQKGIILAVEEAIGDIEGIKEINSSAREGNASISAELIIGADIQRTAQDIRDAVDRITTFPDEAERPVVAIAQRKSRVMDLLIHGSEDEALLREHGEHLRDALLDSGGITQVSLENIRPMEISIEVSHQQLDAYDLTLAQVARAIRENALERPAGGVKAVEGEILLRVDQRRYRGEEFRNIRIKSDSGHILRLGDIATIDDSFEDQEKRTLFNGRMALQIQVQRVGDQTPLAIAKLARQVAVDFEATLPEGLRVDVWEEQSEKFRERRDLLLRNGLMGLTLVILMLGLMLDLRLAFWVTLGIPLSFLGAMAFLPIMDVSINMVSMFAFLLALGIVVDDAIVVGENIYDHQQSGDSGIGGAIRGVSEVKRPVIFSVLTNIIAFLPLMFVPGTTGKIFRNIPAVVILVFAFSLVESLLILPNHLAHTPKPGPWTKLTAPLRKAIERGLQFFIHRLYKPVLQMTLRMRYVTLAIAAAILILSVKYVQGGHIQRTYFPQNDSDSSLCEITLPFGSDSAKTEEAEQQIVAAAERVIKREGGDFVADAMLSTWNDSHKCSIQVRMAPSDKRKVSTSKFTDLWRKETGRIAGLESLKFSANARGPGAGAGISIDLAHRDTKVLEEAASELASLLETFSETTDIDDGFLKGKIQLNFSLSELGERRGLTAAELSLQLRHAFFGAEALRQQRGRDEMRIMVRLPKDERRSLADIQNLLIRLPDGSQVRIGEIAKIVYGRSYTEIKSRNRNQTISVSCDVQPRKSAPIIVDGLNKEGGVRDQLLAKYPGLKWDKGGKDRERAESMGVLKYGFIAAIVAIFCLLAITFKSYLQPVIILIAIPFGLIGALIGLKLLGYNLSIISMMGIVALSGVVINDSLVLVDYTNGLILKGRSVREALIEAACRRFRPITLTTLTTVLGLIPMIFETSRQARFLIPMAVALGAGILFATLITLLLVPTLFLIIEDMRHPLGTSARHQADKALNELENDSREGR